VNAATAWQPRGGEVLISVRGDATQFVGLNFLACFGWDSAQARDYFSSESLKNVPWFEGFVMIRPSEQTGIMNLGVIVPPLTSSPTGLLDRWFSSVRSTVLGLVPVTDMRLIAYTKDGVMFDEVRPIGITSVTYALLLTGAALVLAIVSLHQFVASPRRKELSDRPIVRLTKWIKATISLSWILTLVQTPEGRASLSAFQILLWTLVVAASGMYVMALSGNLINVTPGTLTLLGIAGVAGLIAASDEAGKSKAANTDTAPAQGAVAAGGTEATPRWRDFIVDPAATNVPDISRVQMLVFTIVSAGFVVVQVLNYYVIPDIPAGYQMLLGISNGVYVGRKIGR